MAEKDSNQDPNASQSEPEPITLDAAADPQPQDQDDASAAPDADGEAAGEAVAEEVGQLKGQLMRLAADFDNFRKRAQREKEEIRKYGIERLLRDILPVLDNLERAVAHSDGEESPIAQGVQMVVKQFIDTLQRYGIEPVESKSKPFDPELHEALSQAPSEDVEPGTVLEEVQKGYILNGRLLRPAKVIVAAKPQPQSNPDDEEKSEPPAEPAHES